MPSIAFASVMAIGIVSVAARAGGVGLLSTLLAVVAALVYVALICWALAGRDSLRGHMREPGAALGLLTFVAASDVLASRAGARWLEVALGSVALAGWLVIGGFALRAPRVREEIRGSWLLASVAPHSLAIVAARLAVPYTASWLLALAWVWWLVGVLMYVLVAAPLARHARRRPIELAGDHWIVMGALAIGALAAGGLVRASSQLGWASGFEDVARAAEVVLWIGASAAIPLLLIAEARAWPPSLGIERWSTVFPLGMYATATYALRVRTGVGWLETVATVFLWIAVAALATVAAASTRGLRRSLRPRSRSRQA